MAFQPSRAADSIPYSARQRWLFWGELCLIPRSLLLVLVAGLPLIFSRQVLADNFWNGQPGATAEW